MTNFVETLIYDRFLLKILLNKNISETVVNSISTKIETLCYYIFKDDFVFMTDFHGKSIIVSYKI